jgi:hypothetical protein
MARARKRKPRANAAIARAHRRKPRIVSDLKPDRQHRVLHTSHLPVTSRKIRPAFVSLLSLPIAPSAAKNASASCSTASSTTKNASAAGSTSPPPPQPASSWETSPHPAAPPAVSRLRRSLFSRHLGTGDPQPQRCGSTTAAPWLRQPRHSGLGGPLAAVPSPSSSSFRSGCGTP